MNKFKLLTIKTFTMNDNFQCLLLVMVHLDKAVFSLAVEVNLNHDNDQKITMLLHTPSFYLEFQICDTPC